MAAKLRSIKNDDAWPKVGQTKDEGAGSRAKKMLGSIANDADAVKVAKAAYDKVVTALGKLTSDIQQAVCFAAASKYAWPLLVTKAQASRTSAEPTLTKSQQSMYDEVKSAQGAEAAEQWKSWTLAAKQAKRAAAKK